jgi:hypothetical protein
MRVFYMFYRMLIQYPLRYRLYVTVLVILGLVSCWQVLVYRPLNYSISWYTRKNSILRLKLEELSKAQEGEKLLSRSINDHERDLKEYQATVMSADELVAFVVKQALTTHLSFLMCMAESVNDHGWYQMNSLRVDVQGPLGNVIQWLKAVSSKTSLISMPSISVSQSDPSLVKCSATLSCLNVRII